MSPLVWLFCSSLFWCLFCLLYLAIAAWLAGIFGERLSPHRLSRSRTLNLMLRASVRVLPEISNMRDMQIILKEYFVALVCRSALSKNIKSGNSGLLKKRRFH
jgi:hypothetical protein